MAFKTGSRVRETSTTTGTTSPFALSGAVAGHVTFSSVMAAADTTWYAIVNSVAGEWEVGIGSLTGGPGLSRTAGNVFAGTAGAGVLTNFSAGTKDVFMDFPGELARNLNSTESVVSVVSGATADIGAPGSNRIALSLVTSTITSFGTGAANANLFRIVRLSSASGSTITHNASSLILPGANNVTPVTGDVFIALSDLSGNWRVVTYQRATSSAQQAYKTNASTTATTLANTDVSGGAIETTLNMTGTLGAGANATLPLVTSLVTALQALNQGLVPVGNSSYTLNILNTSSANFAWTVVTNTGWTLLGTMTIAQNTFRKFIVTLGAGASPTTATLQSLGQYAISAGI